MSVIHQFDGGLRFRVRIMKDATTPHDLSLATVKRIKFQRPDGTDFTVNASFESDGTDGRIYYETTSTDLNQVGNWRIQGYVEIGPDTKHTTIERFRVLPNIPLEL